MTWQKWFKLKIKKDITKTKMPKLGRIPRNDNYVSPKGRKRVDLSAALSGGCVLKTPPQ